MKKILAIVIVGLLAACGDRGESPLELVKTATIRDTRDFCMKVNGSRAYCDCEVKDLENTFLWADYMEAVDILAGEKNHIQKVIDKHKGDRGKILAELNCDTCYFSVAMSVVNVSPSPRCAELLK
ncbi:MAG: hypothetical protein LBT45_00015 [Rickettsiales bacterium]|jgi:hypothetical protein|nr:hypothetical protein [Rickettsiales bacterium]